MRYIFILRSPIYQLFAGAAAYAAAHTRQLHARKLKLQRQFLHGEFDPTAAPPTRAHLLRPPVATRSSPTFHPALSPSLALILRRAAPRLPPSLRAALPPPLAPPLPAVPPTSPLGQKRLFLRCCLHEIPWAKSHFHKSNFFCACPDQHIRDSQFPRLRHTRRRHRFAAHAVPELRLLLQHQHARAASRHGNCQCQVRTHPSLHPPSPRQKNWNSS